MSNKDFNLTTAPKYSNFALLAESDDEEASETLMTEDSANSTKNDNSLPISEPTQRVAASSSNNANGDEEWSCASRKSNPKKPSARHQGPSATPSNTPSTHSGSIFLRKGHQQVPLNVDQFSASLTIEIYDFPISWKTSDIKKLLSPFEGQFRLKWQSDTSCWVHFDSEELATRALKEIQSQDVSIRPFDPSNLIVKEPKPPAPPLSPETTVELYSLPPDWRTPQVNDLLTSWTGRYSLKWRNESSCFVIFESSQLLEEAQSQLSKEPSVKVRPFVSRNIA